MKHMRRLSSHDRGAAAVEFALVVPLLLFLLFGIVDFARAFNAQVTVTHAAREAVRVQALEGTTEDTVEAAENAAVPLTVSVTTGGCSSGQPTSVTVTTEFEYVTPVSALAQFFGGSALTSPIQLAGTGVQRCGG